MKEKIHTRDKIINAALDLFSRKGYEGVSIMDITREVGINKATFYSHYESKAMLLEKIFESFKDRISAVGPMPKEYESILKNIQDKKKSSIEKILLDGLDLYLKEYTKPEMAKIIRLAQMEQYSYPSAREFVMNLFHKGPFYIAKRFFKAAMKLKIIKDADACLLACEFESAILIFLQEYIMEDFYNGDTEKIKVKMKKHVRFFCKSILNIIKK